MILKHPKNFYYMYMKKKKKLKIISIQSKPKQIKENPEGTESKMKQQKDLLSFVYPY